MNVGIDRLSFYAPAYFLDLHKLAAVRGVDKDKFVLGLGQERMAVPPPDEDVVTMAASAAKPILDADGADTLGLLVFGTETGVDQSKAAAMFVHGLLELPPACRCVEMKEACYAATAGLQLACAWVAAHPDQSAIVLGADIARYDLRSPGEPTQGAGAIAMRVTANPRLLAIDPEQGVHAEDVMDFWRPNYREEALVDGQYSTRVYLASLVTAWERYRAASGRGLDAFRRQCYHLPFTRIAEKAQARLHRAAGLPAPGPEDLRRIVGESLGYNRITGNTYAASLYEGLACLLDTCGEDLGGSRIGLYSYGSGCMAEFFSGVVQPGYRDALFTARHRAIFEARTELDYQPYEDIFQLALPKDGGEHAFAQYRTGPFRFAGMSQHKRIYEAL
jgi:hydroxymethylglutaryl-CoA synthase